MLFVSVPAAALLVGVGIVAWLLFGPLPGIGAGVVCGVVMWVVSWFGSMRFVLGRLKARPAEEEEFARAFNIVDGLCATMGLPAPSIMAVSSQVPNAMSLGLRTSRSALVLTTALARGSLDPVNMEGILAHELCHIQRGDTAPATVAAAMLMPFNRLFVNAPELLHRLAGRGREFYTDRLAVGITRYPPGLRDALDAIAKAEGEAQGSGRGGSRKDLNGAAKLTRWLWTSVRGAAPESAIGELDLPSVRIAALDEY